MRVIPEKRRSPRDKHDSVFEILDESGARVTCVASLFDFSSSGASFRSTHVFAKGERLQARLHLLREGVLDIAGRIVRVKDVGNSTLYGVKFEAVRPPSR